MSLTVSLICFVHQSLLVSGLHPGSEVDLTKTLVTHEPLITSENEGSFPLKITHTHTCTQTGVTESQVRNISRGLRISTGKLPEALARAGKRMKKVKKQKSSARMKQF